MGRNIKYFFALDDFIALPLFKGRRGHFIPGMGGEMASWGEYAREVRSEIEIIS